MKNCWEYNPVLRPPFSNLVENIGKKLEIMSDFLYVSTFLDEQEEIWTMGAYNILFIIKKDWFLFAMLLMILNVWILIMVFIVMRK